MSSDTENHHQDNDENAALCCGERGASVISIAGSGNARDLWKKAHALLRA
jgi:hypothetical protein